MSSTGFDVQDKTTTANLFVILILLFTHHTNGINHNHTELINELRVRDLLRSKEVEEIMSQVDRGNYVKEQPYEDISVDIGFCANVSAPFEHAYGLYRLSSVLKKGNRALDIGSGSGYLTACMGLMVGSTGRVVGIEHIEELVNISRNNVMKDHPELLKSGAVKFVCGDGRLGYPEGGPYDAIYFGGSVTEIPATVLAQLKNRGRMFVIVGPENRFQKLHWIDKHENGTLEKSLSINVYDMPLCDKESQCAHKERHSAGPQELFESIET